MSLITNWNYPPHHLDSLKWKNRVVLLFAPSAGDAQLVQQLAAVQTKSEAFTERDLVVFTVIGATEQDTQLRQHWKIDPSGYTLLLIGKDGTEKLRKHAVVPTGQILELVDSMPMRRSGGR